MALTPKELRSAIEAIFFASPEPISVEELAEAFPEEGKEAVAEQVEEIRRHFEDNAFGFHLEGAAGGFRFASRPEQDPYLRKFFARQNEGRLSMAALETLAIIAYRQPITAPEISDIRSVNSSGVLRTLLERRMVRIAGRKNVVGSPFLYRTTREFLMHFGLNNIQDLPRLEEFTDILGENVVEELMPNLEGIARDEAAEESAASAAADGQAGEGSPTPEPSEPLEQGQDLAGEPSGVPASDASGEGSPEGERRDGNEDEGFDPDRETVESS